MSLFDKAKDLLGEHADKVEDLSDQGLDRAGEFAESKGLDADRVNQGQEFLDGKIGEAGPDRV
ncbi:antitoxin [Knoellia sp. CPCC 206453]|uniref:antitoxin n=1 Tax=Knoellia pratensis TaxID=3404796 RepID=UPI003621D856